MVLWPRSLGPRHLLSSCWECGLLTAHSCIPLCMLPWATGNYFTQAIPLLGHLTTNDRWMQGYRSSFITSIWDNFEGPSQFQNFPYGQLRLQLQPHCELDFLPAYSCFLTSILVHLPRAIPKIPVWHSPSQSVSKGTNLSLKNWALALSLYQSNFQ